MGMGQGAGSTIVGDIVSVELVVALLVILLQLKLAGEW